MTLEFDAIFETPRNALRSKLRRTVRWGRGLPAAVEHWLTNDAAAAGFRNSPMKTFAISA